MLKIEIEQLNFLTLYMFFINFEIKILLLLSFICLSIIFHIILNIN